MLELPVKLIHSFVVKLSISKPWTSLCSKPIEVVLDKVYIVLTPNEKYKWEFFDYNSLEKK